MRQFVHDLRIISYLDGCLSSPMRVLQGPEVTPHHLLSHPFLDGSVCFSAFALAVSPPWGIFHHPHLSRSTGSRSCHSLTQQQKWMIYSSCENNCQYPPLFLVVYVGDHVNISFQEMYGTINAFRGKVSLTGMLYGQAETHVLFRFTAHLLHCLGAIHFFLLNASSSFFFFFFPMEESQGKLWESLGQWPECTVSTGTRLGFRFCFVYSVFLNATASLLWMTTVTMTQPTKMPTHSNGA